MNRRHALYFLLPVAASFAAEPPATASAPLEAYVGVGLSFARENRLHQLGWSDVQKDAFITGVRAAFEGSTRPIDDEAASLLQKIVDRVQQIDAEEARHRFGAEAFARPRYLEGYLMEMRKRFNLQASDSGLSYSFQGIGNGARPEPSDTVIISYKVTAADMQTELPDLGKERVRVKVQDLLPGLAEGLQMMSIGGVTFFILPPDLSYGDGEWPAGAERGTPLGFAVVLHEIITTP